jgi:hypothetical protein
MSRISVGEDKRKSNKKLKGSKSKKKDDPINLLELIPVILYNWDFQEKYPDRVCILKPRFDTKLGKRLGKKFTDKEAFKINLDEYGTAVWRILDGKLTVGEIGEHLRTQFGDTVEPLYPRLADFLRILEGQKAIEFKRKLPKKKLKRL